MTYNTLRQTLCIDVILAHQTCAHLLLVRRHPGHIEDPVTRPEVLGGIPVTVEAPLHLQCRCAHGEWHLIHPAMAGCAAHSIGNVNTVIEIDKIREIVNPLPAKLCNTGTPAIHHRCQHLLVGKQLGVASHASGNGWDASKAGGFHRLMTVTAIQPNLANMVLVTEWHYLGYRLIDGVHRGGGRPCNQYHDNENGYYSNKTQCY